MHVVPGAATTAARAQANAGRPLEINPAILGSSSRLEKHRSSSRL